MNEPIELNAADGHRLAAYLAVPVSTPRGGLIIVQEIFGVNSHVRAVADGFALDGYLAIAPALFDRVERGVDIGYTPEDIQRGRALKEACSADNAMLDIRGAVKLLQSRLAPGARMGIVGYCWGGLLTWRLACTLSGLSAAAPYYGGGMTVGDEPARQLACPVMVHFGNQDHFIPMDTVEAFKKAQPGVQVHVYDANHGFNCDQRGAYNEAAATLARQRTLEFFAKNLV